MATPWQHHRFGRNILNILYILNLNIFEILTVTFENVCRVHTKREVIIKMKKFNMFITAVCVLFLIKLR